MAFDAGMLRAVLDEIREQYNGAKVEKIQQPTRDEIVIICRGKKININVGSSIPHISLTSQSKDNPASPPMFCLLLRKHLCGALLTDIRQIGFDRIAHLVFSGHDDMGFPTERILAVELMGKYNNLILMDETQRIISAVKYVDFSDSEVRQILPGVLYGLPQSQGKINPLTTDKTLFLERVRAFAPEKNAARYIADTYSGIAIGVAREIVFRATGKTDVSLGDLVPEKLADAFMDWFLCFSSRRYHPFSVSDALGNPVAYCYQPLTYYGDGEIQTEYSSCAELFDRYFAEKERAERIRQRAADIVRIVSRTETRLAHKLELQKQELVESEKSEAYRKNGDLITANLYRIRRGMDSVVVMDYGQDPPVETEVKLDPRLYPAQNAQKMYKLYNKAKTANRILREQIAISEDELRYMESVRAFLDRAATEADLAEIRDELFRSGYASKMKGYRPQKQVKPRPITYLSSGGYRILCGRNNLQNDLLTFHIAEKSDLWFHAKGVPGSHVILVCGGEEPPEKDYTEAAQIAAFHSKATGDLVAVDYTRVKNVKKPASSKPGFVIYKTNYTAFVHPQEGQETK